MKKSEAEKHKNLSFLPDKLSTLESEKKVLLSKKKVIERKIESVERIISHEASKYFQCDACLGFILKKKVSIEQEEKTFDSKKIKIKFYICPYCGHKVETKKENI